MTTRRRAAYIVLVNDMVLLYHVIRRSSRRSPNQCRHKARDVISTSRQYCIVGPTSIVRLSQGPRKPTTTLLPNAYNMCHFSESGHVGVECNFRGQESFPPINLNNTVEFYPRLLGAASKFGALHFLTVTSLPTLRALAQFLVVRSIRI